MDFFEENGLRIKTERGNRVFPQSDHASDVTRTLETAMRRAGVNVKLQAKVTEVEVKDGCVTGIAYENCRDKGNVSFRKVTEISPESGRNNRNEAGRLAETTHTGKFSEKNMKRQFYPCDAVIMATGGCSYPSTGSDGSGWEMLRQLGHTCTELRPSLVGMLTKEDYIPKLQGLSLKNISFTVRAGKKKIFEEFGELLFTHRGITGPVVLTASSVIPDKYFRLPDDMISSRDLRTSSGMISGRKDTDKDSHLPSCAVQGHQLQSELIFEIDLKPSLSEEQLDQRIQRDFAENANRQFKNALGKLLPAKMISVVVRLSGIDPEKKVNAVTREERRQLLLLLKHFPGTITGLGGWPEAVITRGGIRVTEVDPSTMESRIVSGLYLCGEMLDLDAVTGGFNLQIAWSTGHLAGISVK